MLGRFAGNGKRFVSLGAVSQLTGIPEKELHRKVVIKKPTKTAMQSGTQKRTDHWELEFFIRATWANPLMGWTSTRDPLENTVDFHFDTLDEAKSYCEKYGYEYDVRDESGRSVAPKLKSYATNFEFHGWQGNLKKQHMEKKNLSSADLAFARGSVVKDF